MPLGAKIDFKGLLPQAPIEVRTAKTRKQGGRMFLHRARRARVLAIRVALCITLLHSSLASAGYLVQNATITRLTNVADNAPKFAIQVTGGSGPCSTSTIEFPASAAVDLEAHRRAYATLLMAFASGMHISVVNYNSDSCVGASYVEAFN
jgi:hypothetical protein